MTSSSKNEVSHEDNTLKHGFFTAALLEVFAGEAHQDGNVIFLTDVYHRVTQLTSDKDPQHPDFVMNGEMPIFSIRP